MTTVGIFNGYRLSVVSCQLSQEKGALNEVSEFNSVIS